LPDGHRFNHFSAPNTPPTLNKMGFLKASVISSLLVGQACASLPSIVMKVRFFFLSFHGFFGILEPVVCCFTSAIFRVTEASG
jgi:hypothetical protein